MPVTRRLGEDVRGYPFPPLPSYRLADVDQLQAARLHEVRPREPAARASQARALERDAAVYGGPSVLLYAPLSPQAVDREAPGYTGFAVFAHDRDLAGPGYRAFKTPNADTLYSNAWLDLRAGPVLVDVPAFAGRYYTLNFLDMYSNATNISTGTAGGDGGRYLVATPDWAGEVPADVTLFRVATGWMWLLLRIFADGPADIGAARDLQDAVRLTPLGRGTGDTGEFPPADAESVRTDWRAFFQVLDFVLRTTSHPDQEDALVYRFRALGLGAEVPWRSDELDEADQAGMSEGFTDALQAVVASRSSLGIPLEGTGWSRGRPAAHGFNYLRRAATNQVGLGATVVQENQAFMCWYDADGDPLDGTRGRYELAIPAPPPVDAFWSVTAYDAGTLELYPNELNRYSLSDRTPGLRHDEDGCLRVLLQAGRPASAANWLPVPAGRFYLCVRAYRPRPELLDGGWAPEPVRLVGHPS